MLRAAWVLHDAAAGTQASDRLGNVVNGWLPVRRNGAPVVEAWS